MKRCGGEISTITDRRPSGMLVLHNLPAPYTPENPPRVYLPNMDYPGLAMTRSIGDSDASKCNGEKGRSEFMRRWRNKRFKKFKKFNNNKLNGL